MVCPAAARLTQLPPREGAPLRYRLGSLRFSFTDHAALRCRQRVIDPRAVVLLVAALEHADAVLAAVPCAVRLRLSGRLSAVVRPTDEGWCVVTVIRHGRLPPMRRGHARRRGR